MKIDKDIPIPERLPTLQWPFGEMEVGDSIAVPKDYLEKCRSAAGSYSRQHKEYKFSIRKVEDGWRCWRIATTEENQ